MNCRFCNAELPEESAFCPRCGKSVTDLPREKSRAVAGVLALTLGVFGIHNFYLGHRPKALTQLVMSTVGGVFSCGVSTIAIGIWALCEAVGIFTGKRTV